MRMAHDDVLHYRYGAGDVQYAHLLARVAETERRHAIDLEQQAANHAVATTRMVETLTPAFTASIAAMWYDS
jgi:hypothetical protein